MMLTLKQRQRGIQYTNRPTAVYIMQSAICISVRYLTCLYLVAAVFYCVRKLKGHLFQILISRSEIFVLLNHYPTDKVGY